jgi:hypothetical protein
VHVSKQKTPTEAQIDSPKPRKTREFWLDGDGGYLEHRPNSSPYFYHVIEISAIEELRRENERLSADNRFYKGQLEAARNCFDAETSNLAEVRAEIERLRSEKDYSVFEKQKSELTRALARVEKLRGVLEQYHKEHVEMLNGINKPPTEYAFKTTASEALAADDLDSKEG